MKQNYLIFFIIIVSTLVFSDILVVDDDGSERPGGTYQDVQSYYTDALDNIGYEDYTVYVVDYNSSGPDISILDDYSTVIWFTGEMFTNNSSFGYTLTTSDETYIEEFLTNVNNNTNLFLVSQDYITSKYGSGIVNFSSGNWPYDVLKLNSVDPDYWTDPSQAWGVSGTVGDGINFSLDFSLYNTRSGLPDLLTHHGTTCINQQDSSTGPSSIQNEEDVGGYTRKLVFLTTSFEGISNSSQRDTLMDNIVIDFFEEPPDAITSTSIGKIKALFNK
jgi:hypothetical protein